MRGPWRAAAAFLLCTVPLRPARAEEGPTLELELAAGLGTAGSSAQVNTNSPFPWAPVVTGRVGVDLWNVFTPSLRVFAAAGPGGAESAHGGPEYRAVSGLLELRVHSPGVTQVYAGAGAGIGRVIGLQRNDSFESNRIFSEAGPAYLGVLGIRRWLGPRIALGAEGAVGFWTGAAHGGQPGTCCSYQAGGPPESGLLVTGTSIILSLTMLPGR